MLDTRESGITGQPRRPGTATACCESANAGFVLYVVLWAYPFSTLSGSMVGRGSAAAISPASRRLLACGSGLSDAVRSVAVPVAGPVRVANTAPARLAIRGGRPVAVESIGMRCSGGVRNARWMSRWFISYDGQGRRRFVLTGPGTGGILRAQ